MTRYRFDYPSIFTSLDDYTAHRGQEVEVVRRLRRDEFDFDGEAMFLIRADDGWEGQAWRSELVHPSAPLDFHRYEIVSLDGAVAA